MTKNKNGLRGLTLSALAAAMLSALPAWAVDPFTLRDIRVEGRVQSDSPNTPGVRDRQAAVELQFRQRF